MASTCCAPRYVTHRYGRHAHETYTFGLIEAGVEEFEYGGSLLRAGPGAVALLNPDVVHTGQAATPGGWTYRVLYPQVSVVTDVAAELGWDRGTPRFPQTVLYDPATAALLRSAHVAAEHGDQLASSTLLRTALAGLLRAHAAAGPARQPPARRAGRPPRSAPCANCWHERLADPPALAELAAMTGLSQFALLRAFRGETGLPPHAYLNQLRVRRARLLLDAGLPPADVAAADRLRRSGAPDPALQARRRRAARPPTSASDRQPAPAEAEPGRQERTRPRRPAASPTISGYVRADRARQQRRPARPVRDGIGLGLAVGVSGVAFGAAAVSSGLSAWQACALSLLAFTGASQFALAGVIAAGGSLLAGHGRRDPAGQPQHAVRAAAGRRAAAARAAAAARRARRHRRDHGRRAGAARPGRGPDRIHGHVLLPVPDLEPGHAGRRARRRAGSGHRSRSGWMSSGRPRSSP